MSFKAQIKEKGNRVSPFMLSMGFVIASLGPNTLWAAGDMLRTMPGGTAEHPIGYSASRKCELVVTQECSARPARLGTVRFRKSPMKADAALSVTLAKCANPADGSFRGTGNGRSAVTAILFEAGRRHGYEQITVTCKKSDGSTQQHYLKVGVMKQ